MTDGTPATGAWIRELWAGRIPLDKAFWGYAIILGLLINLATSLVFLVLFINDAHPAILGAAYALPLPYNLLCVVGVWRAAGRHAGPPQWPLAARAGVIAWMVLLTAT